MHHLSRRQFLKDSGKAVALTGAGLSADALAASEEEHSVSAAPAGDESIGRPVNIVSLSFPLSEDRTSVKKTVEKEAARQPDIMVLPEAWNGPDNFETLEGPSVSFTRRVASRHSVYIACPIFRREGDTKYNSVVLVNRSGEVAAVYNKMYPFWKALNYDPPVVPGDEGVVHETDVGRVGFAVCFDANFPDMWRKLGRKGAELVLFPSYYRGGRQLRAHALNNHYYAVSSTRLRDCLAYDITGTRILHETQDQGINVTRLGLDLDRCIFHEDFNMEDLDRLLKDHEGDVEVEKRLQMPAWFVLKAKRPGISARELAHEYGLEELRAYKERSRRHIDKLRSREGA